MEKAAIRPAQSAASSNPVARNAHARQAAGQEAGGTGAGFSQGNFSLLLSDMAASGAPGATGMGGVAGEELLAGTDLPLAALGGLAPVEAIAEAGILALSSLVGQTARMDAAADAAQRDGRDLPASEGLRRSVALPMGAGQPAGAAQLPALAAAGAHGKGAADAVDAMSVQDLAEAAGTADACGSTLSLTPSERGAQPHALAALLAQMEPEPQPLPSALAAPGLPGAASAAAQANGSSPATGPGGADSAAPLGAADAPATDMAADAVLAQPDDAFVDQLSEQVAFWVQQKTQRAEMTIDRQGQPVQVQVAITGNEAHVTFRSNEQQTRDMLDASMAQLREMLEQQGLNLAGVTVQSGDAGGQGAAPDRNPAGRPAPGRGEGVPQTAQVTVDLRARPDATRSVDLFV